MTNIEKVEEKLKNRIKACTFSVVKSAYDDLNSTVCFIYIINHDPLTYVAAQINSLDGNCQSHIREQLEAMLADGRITQVMYSTANAPADQQQFLVDIEDINPSQPCLAIQIGMTYLVRLQDELDF